MKRTWCFFLLFVSSRASILPLPRRGARVGALVIVPGFNARAIQQIVNGTGLNGTVYPMRAEGDAYENERVLGVEIATAHDYFGFAPSISDAWVSAGRSVGIVTSSCVLDSVITPFVMPAVESIEIAAREVRALAHPPRVWLGGRGGALEPQNLGRPPYCLALNETELDACAQQAPVGALYGEFGSAASVFARRCQFVPNNGPSIAKMSRDGIKELRGNEGGWFLVVYMNEADRAGHANSVSKMTDAIARATAAVREIADEFARANWTDAVLVIASPYDTGGFDGTNFSSALHVGDGALFAHVGSSVAPHAAPDKAYGPRDVAGFFVPGLSAVADAHPLSFIIHDKPRSIRNSEPRLAWIFLGSLCTVLLVAVSYAINAFSVNVKKTAKLRQHFNSFR